MLVMDLAGLQIDKETTHRASVLAETCLAAQFKGDFLMGITAQKQDGGTSSGKVRSLAQKLVKDLRSLRGGKRGSEKDFLPVAVLKKVSQILAMQA